MRFRRGPFQHGSVGAHHLPQELRLCAYASLSECGVARRYIDRCHLVGAQRHRRSGSNIIAKTHLPRDLHHAAISDHFCDLHRCHVQRICQCVANGDMSHEFLAVIIRRVFLPIELERCRFVVHRCRRRYDRLHAVHGVIECCRVYERLEDRTRLPVRDRVI